MVAQRFDGALECVVNVVKMLWRPTCIRVLSDAAVCPDISVGQHTVVETRCVGEAFLSALVRKNSVNAGAHNIVHFDTRGPQFVEIGYIV